MAKDKSSKNMTMVPATEEALRDQLSPYLKFQDKNGDGMPDVCDDVTPPVPTTYFLRSSPNAGLGAFKYLMCYRITSNSQKH